MTEKEMGYTGEKSTESKIIALTKITANLAIKMGVTPEEFFKFAEEKNKELDEFFNKATEFGVKKLSEEFDKVTKKKK